MSRNPMIDDRVRTFGERIDLDATLDDVYSLCRPRDGLEQRVGALQHCLQLRQSLVVV